MVKDLTAYLKSVALVKSFGFLAEAVRRTVVSQLESITLET
jgi:hypothetical protein